jgi:hypothetical protein
VDQDPTIFHVELSVSQWKSSRSVPLLTGSTWFWNL